MGELAPHGWFPGSTTSRPDPREPGTPEQLERIGKKNVLEARKTSVIPFLGKVVYKNMTVKEYGDLLMETAEIPEKYREPFLTYVLPFLNPALNPDYAVLLVEAGQPCKKNRLKKDFDSLDAAVQYGKEQGLDEEGIETVLNGRYIANTLLIAFPLGYSGIGQNLDYDINGNAIGAKEFEVNRMYPCDRFLELKYPEAHAAARTRWISIVEKQLDGNLKTFDKVINEIPAKKEALNEAIDAAIEASGHTWEKIPGLITKYVDAVAIAKLAKKRGILAYDIEADAKYAAQIIPILQKAADKNERAVVPPRPAETSAAKLAIEQRANQAAKAKLAIEQRANQTAKAGRRRSKTNRKTRKNKKEHRNVVPSHRKRRGTARR